MYLSLLRLNPTDQRVQQDLRDPHSLHQTVMRAFASVLDPEQEARAFWGVLHRLEFERRSGRILLYVQSRVEPDWSFLPATSLVEDGLANPSVKSVDATYGRIAAGQTLRFRIRANPTRKIDTKSGPNGERRNGRRVPLVGLDAQVEWLSRKAGESGFRLLQVTVAATGSPEMVRSHSRGCAFQGVVFEGRLVVHEPDRFRAALVQGIGPGKAFGFGLLSVGAD